MSRTTQNIPFPKTTNKKNYVEGRVCTPPWHGRSENLKSCCRGSAMKHHHFKSSLQSWKWKKQEITTQTLARFFISHLEFPLPWEKNISATKRCFHQYSLPTSPDILVPSWSMKELCSINENFSNQIFTNATHSWWWCQRQWWWWLL